MAEDFDLEGKAPPPDDDGEDKLKRKRAPRKASTRKPTTTLADLRDAVTFNIEMLANGWGAVERAQVMRLGIPEDDWPNVPSAAAALDIQKEELAELAMDAARRYPGVRKFLEGASAPVMLLNIVRVFAPIGQAAMARRATLAPIREQRIEEEKQRLSAVPDAASG